MRTGQKTKHSRTVPPAPLPFAFWDTSAIVPMCVFQDKSARVRQAARTYRIAVWWATSTEACSAIYRLRREGAISAAKSQDAIRIVDYLREKWDEITPNNIVREQAERLLARHKLRSADALQLAAALQWCRNYPKGKVFIAGDGDLLEAAEMEGFTRLSV